jgi:hypothetical protein
MQSEANIPHSTMRAIGVVVLKPEVADLFNSLGSSALISVVARNWSSMKGASLPSTWATACWPISATPERMSMMPNSRCAPDSVLATRLPKLVTKAGSPLQVRVGIATGLVAVGDLIGEGAAQEQAVVGEMPNRAARLPALAEPGTVVIAASTQQLTGGLFEYRDLGAVQKASPRMCGHGKCWAQARQKAGSRTLVLRARDMQRRSHVSSAARQRPPGLVPALPPNRVLGSVAVRF